MAEQDKNLIRFWLVLTSASITPSLVTIISLEEGKEILSTNFQVHSFEAIYLCSRMFCEESVIHCSGGLAISGWGRSMASLHQW